MRLPLCVRVEQDDHQSATALFNDGWLQKETLEVWAGDLPRSRPISSFLDIAYAEDCEQCVSIAGRAFKYDRLHKDERVPDSEAEEFKRQCVRDSFERYDGFLWVYRVEGTVRGFLFVDYGRVQMVAVDPDFHGKGIGHALFGFLEGPLEAGTQSDNKPAKHLYAALGMKHTRTLRTFHKIAPCQ